MAKLRVLIVEDDAILCFLNRKQIELLGYEVVAVVKNGIDAIAAAKKYKPNFILMDIRLQGDLDGIDTMNEIAKFLDAPVIYTTASWDEIYRTKITKNRVLGFCNKPIAVGELELLLLGMASEK
jgi:two-component system, response regulator PdtaR